MLKTVTINQLEPLLREGWSDSLPMRSTDLGGATGPSLVATCGDRTRLVFKVYTATTFFRAIRGKTLYPTILACRERSEWVIVIIVGILAPDKAGQGVTVERDALVSWEGIQTALLHLQQRGVGYVNLPASADIPAFVERIAKEDREDLTTRTRPLRNVLWADPAEDALMALPGIGPERADALLDYCGNLLGAIIALADPDAAIPGIPVNVREQCRATVTKHLSATTEHPDAVLPASDASREERQEAFLKRRTKKKAATAAD